MINAQTTEYSEFEAASLLGVTIEQLRLLVQRHIVGESYSAPAPILSRYLPSDLVVLRILSSARASARA